MWREIRDALRTSPDHLIARAESLIAEADPARLFEFVRDTITTYPSGPYGTAPLSATRWGTRGTLRGGAGTPREKAELLAELYRRAGWKAEVLQASIRTPEEAVKRLLLGASGAPSFAPKISDRQLGRWRKQLGLPNEPAALPRIDRDGRESTALARNLERALPSERTRKFEFDWRWRGNTPVVRVQAGDQTHYANLFSPDLAFGDAGTDPQRLRPAPEAAETPKVEVVLSTAVESNPSGRIELVKGTWSLDDLVGRQLVMRMLPGLDLRRQAVSTFRDITTFIPSLAVQGFDLDQAQMAALSFMGDPITRDGDRIEISPDGSVSVEGRIIAGAKAGASADAVSAISIEVDSSQYPNIRIDARATDSQGRQVEGLVASDFLIEEDGRSTGFMLSANRAAPRILFLSDASGSMPPEYRGKGMDVLVADLSQRVRAVYPHASIRAQATTSELWKWLAWGAGTDANLIIFATDGHSDGELTDAFRAKISGGPRLVILNVRGYDENNFWHKRTLQPMAEVANGTIVPAGETEEAHAALLSYLSEIAPELPPYRFSYGAPGDTPGERKVRLAVATGRVSGGGSYVAPESAPPIAKLSGLYLKVTIGNQSVERTLAGHDPVRQANQPVTDANFNETLGALFGTHYLSFEAGAPSFSIWLDEFLTSKLSIAPLDKALNEKASLDELEAIVQKGFFNLPPDLILQTLPIKDAKTATSLTYEDGPRVMLYQAYPVFGASHLVRHLDFLPFTKFATAAEKSDDAFRLTLEKTARFAIAESELFPVSTRSMLEGKSLIDYRSMERDATRPSEQRALWNRHMRRFSPHAYRLVAVDGSTLAFWSIDHQSGTLLGILPDGSGGGSAEERLQKQLEEIEEVMAFYNTVLGEVAGLAGVPTPGTLAIGIVGEYGLLLVRLYAAASLAIAVMDASGLEEAVGEALEQFACNVKKSIFAAALGPAGDAFTGLDLLISAIGGDENNPLAC